MNIAILGLIGISLAATSLARMFYERRLGRKSADSALDRFHRLEVAKQHQLASPLACGVLLKTG
jgi:hypothetical protein